MENKKVGEFRLNEKLTNKFINALSCVGTILGLHQAIQAIMDQQCLKSVVSIGFTLGSVWVLIFFHYNKKKYVDLYAVCSSMSLNNRLQSLREMILIKHREIIGNDNKYKIKNAKFYYILSQSETNENAYDLHYSISFKLCKTWFMRKCTRDRTLRFFVLTLSSAPQNFIAEIITESEMSVESYSTIIECAKKDYTTRGESGSKEKVYSGLYEIITVIPQDIAKKKQIEIRFSYDVLGQIKKAQDKHSFTIIPRNYSTKINKFEVRVQTKNIPIDNLELQRYGISGDFEIVELFIPCEPTNLLFESSGEETIVEGASEHYALVKPDMNSAYSIQFDLPKQNGGK